MARITVTNERPTLDIPEGTHEASVTTVEEGSGDYGAYIKLTYRLKDVEDDDGNPQNVTQFANIDKLPISPGTKLYSILSALLYDGQPIPDEDGEDGFDPDDLVGKRCTIWWGTEINKRTKKPFTGILKVTAPPRKQATKRDKLAKEIEEA